MTFAETSRLFYVGLAIQISFLGLSTRLAQHNKLLDKFT